MALAVMAGHPALEQVVPAEVAVVPVEQAVTAAWAQAACPMPAAVGGAEPLERAGLVVQTVEAVPLADSRKAVAAAVPEVPQAARGLLEILEQEQADHRRRVAVEAAAVVAALEEQTAPTGEEVRQVQVATVLRTAVAAVPAEVT